MTEGRRTNRHFNLLLPDQGVREIDVAADVKFVCRVNSNTAIAFCYLERLQNLKIPPLTAEASARPHAKASA